MLRLSKNQDYGGAQIFDVLRNQGFCIGDQVGYVEVKGHVATFIPYDSEQLSTAETRKLAELMTEKEGNDAQDPS